MQHQAAASADPQIAASARRRLATLGMLRLHLHNPGTGQEVDLAAYLRDLCGMEQLPFLASGGVSVHADFRTVAVPAEAAARIGLAFCELLRNALVHAYPLGERRRVGVHLWPVSVLPHVRAFLFVADSGLGFDNEPPAASERGIPFARHLAERCGCTLTREPGRGTVWRVTLRQEQHRVGG